MLKFLAFLFIAGAITWVIVVLSSDAKVGDPLFFVKDSWEGLELSLSALTASDKFELESQLAQQRLKEAALLNNQPQRAQDYQQEIQRYQQLVEAASDSLDTSVTRGFDIVDFIPTSTQMSVDNLKILAQLYQTQSDNQSNLLDQPIRLTIALYQKTLAIYQKTKGDGATLQVRSEFLDVQDQLSAKDAPTSP